jgi:hypothetical protein
MKKGSLVFYDRWGTINGAFRNRGHTGLSLDGHKAGIFS